MRDWRAGLCLAMLLTVAGALEAGHRKHCPGCKVQAMGCAAPVASCAVPMTCATPAYAAPTCARPTCGSPWLHGCAAPAGCAAPLNCAAPGMSIGVFSHGAGYGFAGGPGPITFPTAGIRPNVIPGNELVW